jgi:hypothetical protein
MDRYWIAINGSSCALSTLPWRDPTTVPVAQQMFGFPTLREAKEAQRICLDEPIEKVKAWMESLRPDVASGRVLYKRPAKPDTPTFGETMWMESIHEEMVELAREAQAKAYPLPGLPGGPALN